jgi:alpha-beta hydrolase superfamily lysophospholipase
MRLMISFLIGLLLILPANAQHKSIHEIGIVLLHGKGGRPSGTLSGLADELSAQGIKVTMPTMAWSGRGGHPDRYDVTYENALHEIDQSIQTLKAKGATAIVVAGHSLGANAAIAYGATHKSNIVAVIALAPAHTPERMRAPEILSKIDEARSRISSGQGRMESIFPDLNVGDRFEVKGNYLGWFSYFNPNGSANMSKMVTQLHVPLLVVSGTSDPTAQQIKSTVFERAPTNTKNKYIEINSGHFDMPENAHPVILNWLSTL